MFIAENYRMFRYPKNVASTTGSVLNSIWSLPLELDNRVSESEFYENGYRGSKYPEGPSCFECLFQLIGQILSSVITIAVAVGVAVGAFIIGAVLDGLQWLSNCLIKDSTEEASAIISQP